VEGIISWHVLDVVLQRGLRQDNFVLVDLVNGVLEGQLRTAILLVMSEYSACKSKQDRDRVNPLKVQSCSESGATRAHCAGFELMMLSANDQSSPINANKPQASNKTDPHVRALIRGRALVLNNGNSAISRSILMRSSA